MVGLAFAFDVSGAPAGVDQFPAGLNADRVPRVAGWVGWGRWGTRGWVVVTDSFCNMLVLCIDDGWDVITFAVAADNDAF